MRIKPIITTASRTSIPIRFFEQKFDISNLPLFLPRGHGPADATGASGWCLRRIHGLAVRVTAFRLPIQLPRLRHGPPTGRGGSRRAQSPPCRSSTGTSRSCARTRASHRTKPTSCGRPSSRRRASTTRRCGICRWASSRMLSSMSVGSRVTLSSHR